MRRPATLLLTLTLFAAACGDDDAVTTTAAITTTAVTVAGSTTTAGTTTTAAATTTTTTAPAFVIDTTDFFPNPLPGSDDANGSGCVTDSAALGDGIWFGFAAAVAGGTITFDLACFFTGAAAVAAATADGAEAFDFYIRNQNPNTYSVAIAGSAQVYYVDMTGGPEPTPIALASWPTPASYVPCPGEFCAVWLYVNGGVATGIVEQYLP